MLGKSTSYVHVNAGACRIPFPVYKADGCCHWNGHVCMHLFVHLKNGAHLWHLHLLFWCPSVFLYFIINIYFPHYHLPTSFKFLIIHSSEYTCVTTFLRIYLSKEIPNSSLCGHTSCHTQASVSLAFRLVQNNKSIYKFMELWTLIPYNLPAGEFSLNVLVLLGMSCMHPLDGFPPEGKTYGLISKTEEFWHGKINVVGRTERHINDQSWLTHPVPRKPHSQRI